MTTEHQREQQERRETLENDRRVREQQHGMTEPKTTFSTFAEAFATEDRQGRFRGQPSQYIVGSEPIVRYPELPETSPFHHDPVGQEPPLNFQETSALEPVGTFPEVQQSLEKLGVAEPPPGPPEGEVRSGNRELDTAVVERSSPLFSENKE